MDEVQEIKHRLDIVEVISSYLTLKKAGVNYKGLCPFHNEKTPSFMVSPERQTFKCFGCSEGGDIFTFIEKMEGLDFYNALKILADRAGVQLKSRSVRRGEQEHKADRKTRLFEINDWARRVYYKLLLDHPKADTARSYLKKRGLDQKTITDFQIGYAPDSWDFLIRFLKSKEYTEEEMLQAGLVVRNDRGKYYDRFRGRVMFPISNIMGGTIAFTSRTLKDDAKEAKYINSADSPIYTKGEVLYGLDRARQAIREKGLAIIVEGNMDVIACHQAGFANVVASSGTALTEHQLKIIGRYAGEIAFCFDTDEAGLAAMKRAVTLALKNDVTAKIVAIPAPFKDPDEAIRADSKNWTRAVLAAKLALEHWIDLLVRQNPDLLIPAKKQIAREILPVIKITYSEIEKEGYLRYLANKLAVSERSLAEALEKTRGERAAGGSASAGSPPKLSLAERIGAFVWFEPARRELVRALIADPAFALPQTPVFREILRQEDFEREKVPAAEANLLDQMILLLSAEMDLTKAEVAETELVYLAKRWQNEKREAARIRFAAKIRQAEEQGDKGEVGRLIAEFSQLIK
ncbi:MAG: DNA primase [Patescibacteria group bacterium]